MKIEAVILYSTNDFRFYNICINNLLKCGIKCHIISYTHMWNGLEEDYELLDKSANMFSDDTNFNFYKINWESRKDPWYWEGLGRYLGTQRVSDDCDYVLYIDIDEVVDVDLFLEYIKEGTYLPYDAIKLADYWYFREPIYQSKEVEYNTVMVSANLSKSLPLIETGREQYFKYAKNKTLQHTSETELPFVHHFSWVRSKGEMLNKVSNWGHASDRKDWKILVEEEFSRPFNGTDFVHGYSYSIVENKFNI